AEFNYRRGKKDGAYFLYEKGAVKEEGAYADGKVIRSELHEPAAGEPPEVPLSEQVPPSFPCGNAGMQKENCAWSSMKAFIDRTPRYPRQASKLQISGTVLATFTVHADGSISDIACPRGVSDAVKAECVRGLGLMPGWVPGKAGGVPANFQVA